ncbi:MAG: ATP-binding cassette domain-containing protein [Bacteroidales bacterium]|nr:ATP-binding cassette domain-containing protein [Bacteroidales bacterium]
MIEIKNLAFSYGKTNVLDNISMTLEAGKIYGLLGENGVGKTTLLTLLCGLKKPIEGSISAGGVDPYRRLPSFLENLYYLPDEVAPLNSSALDWARNCGKFWPAFSLDTFNNIMAEFETDPLQKMKAMSAGQLKKAYIAFALAAGTQYLLMDEPTNGLDIPSKAQFRAAIMKYTREDSTIVISTHQVRDLENVIDPIVILDRRDVLLNASIAEISEKLYFDYGTELRSDALYSERLPGGFIQVCPNTSGKESKVNVEALFNTVHNNKELVKGIFSHE